MELQYSPTSLTTTRTPTKRNGKNLKVLALTMQLFLSLKLGSSSVQSTVLGSALKTFLDGQVIHQ